MTSRLSTSLQSPRDLMNCRSRQFLVLADFRGIFQLGLCVQLQGHLDSTCSEQRGRRGPEELENRFRMNFHSKHVHVQFVHFVGYKKGASEHVWQASLSLWCYTLLAVCGFLLIKCSCSMCFLVLESRSQNTCFLRHDNKNNYTHLHILLHCYIWVPLQQLYENHSPK